MKLPSLRAASLGVVVALAGGCGTSTAEEPHPVCVADEPGSCHLAAVEAAFPTCEPPAGVGLFARNLAERTPLLMPAALVNPVPAGGPESCSILLVAETSCGPRVLVHGHGAFLFRWTGAEPGFDCSLTEDGARVCSAPLSPGLTRFQISSCINLCAGSDQVDVTLEDDLVMVEFTGSGGCAFDPVDTCCWG